MRNIIDMSYDFNTSLEYISNYCMRQKNLDMDVEINASPPGWRIEAWFCYA